MPSLGQSKTTETAFLQSHEVIIVRAVIGSSVWANNSSQGSRAQDRDYLQRSKSKAAGCHSSKIAGSRDPVHTFTSPRVQSAGT